MRQVGYITIEECTGDKDFHGVPQLIVEEFSNIEVTIIEENNSYFVLKYICEDFEDVQQIASICAYIITGELINKFSITVNNEDL
jgi:hypothetical protein